MRTLLVSSGPYGGIGTVFGCGPGFGRRATVDYQYSSTGT